MKDKFKKIILFLMVIGLMFSIVGCADPDDSGTGVDPGPVIPPPIVVEKDVVFGKITDGLINSGGEVIKDNTYVKSKYGIILGQANLTIYYEANYSERKQDSELLLRIYDEQNYFNRIFVYYTKGDLFYGINEKRFKVEGFGSSSMFDTVYDVMTYFDLRSTFYSATFTEYFDMLKNIVSDKMITIIPIDGKIESFAIENVNLDRAKKPINDFVSSYFGQVGTKLDLITNELLGINFSDLSHFEINRLDGNLFQFAIQDNKIQDMNLHFSGIQTDNITTFDLKIGILSGVGTTKLGTEENLGNYEKQRQGESHYVGKLEIPMLNNSFNIDIKSKINNTDDANNEISVLIQEDYLQGKNVMGLYYQGGTFYADIANFKDKYLGNGIKLGKLNFPKVKFSGLNLASELNLMFNSVKEAIARMLVGGLPDFDINAPDNLVSMILDNTRTEGDVIYITITQELISKILGDNYSTMVDYLAEKLGLDRQTVETLLKSLNLEDAKIIISYNVSSRVVGIDLVGGDDETIIRLELTSVDIDADKEFVIGVPDGMLLADHKEFLAPQNILLDINGDIRMQGQDKADFSKFLGVFLGDTTGNNTPYYLSTKESLRFSLKGYEQFNKTSIMASISKWNTSSNTKIEDIVSISTSSENVDVYLINFHYLGIKYQIDRDGLNEAFKDLLGGDNIFSDENIFKLFSLIQDDTSMTINDENLHFSLAPYTNDNGEYIDPLYNLLGIRNLLSDFTCEIDFNQTLNLESKDDYYVPQITKLQETVFTSMYEAVWHDTVKVMFGSVEKEFKLSFLGDSAKLVSNKFYYTPEAKLLGADVSYVMVLTDTANGTKIIKELDTDKIVIDPSIENSFPTEIDVIYFNPTDANPDGISKGKLPFDIVGFPFNADNIVNAMGGLASQNYKIIIGKGSIAEREFIIPIEVLGRLIVPQKTVEGFDDYIDGVPVVDEIKIDPIVYSFNKMADSGYNPFILKLMLKFLSNQNIGNEQNPIVEIIEVSNFEWQFNEKLITYGGGEYYAYGYFNSLKIALRVTVVPKVVTSIQVEGEKENEYTIDSLIFQTYSIPTISITNREVRIYFESGRYRIVGDGPLTADDLPTNCDGYYPLSLKWTYPVANNVAIDGTTNPLENGTTNVNQADFGNELIGEQKIRLTVVCPSRKAGDMPETQFCITDYVIGTDGVVTGSKKEAVKYSKVAFPGLKVGEFYKFNPYETDEAKKRLPSAIQMEVKKGSETVMKTYKITYINSNIVDETGRILHPTNQNEFLMVQAVLGDSGEIYQTITLIVENLSGIYESVKMVDPISSNEITLDGQNRLLVTRNPYAAIQLPTQFTLKFAAASGIRDQVYSANWFYTQPDGSKVKIIDGRYFKYVNAESIYKITSYIAKDDEQGILEQEVSLYIKVENFKIREGIIYGLMHDEPNLEYATDFENLKIDTYELPSKKFLDRLIGGVKSIGVMFENNQRLNGLLVDWDNMTDIISLLKQTTNKTVKLTGKIYKGYNAEQAVSIDITAASNLIDTISYIRKDGNYDKNGVLAISTDLSQKTIVLTLYKPYLLTANFKDDNGEMVIGGLATPKQYIEYFLSEIQLNLNGSTSKKTIPNFVLPDDFNKLVIQSSLIETSVGFNISNLTQGSADDNFRFTVVTKQDKVVNSLSSKIVEVYDSKGALKYLEGYNIPKKYTILYKNTGNVEYSDIIWRAQNDHSVTVGDGIGQKLITRGEEVKVIDSKLFDLKKGLTVSLYTTLPNGQQFILSITFPKKNIAETQFNATAEDTKYNVRGGTININNVYSLYPFNPTKLPTEINPLKTNPEYGVSEEYDVTFRVMWVLDAAFLKGGIFDQTLINSKGLAKTLLATATINFYNGEQQTVKLYVEVDALEEGSLSHEKIKFVNNIATIDPYVDNFGGKVVLPKDFALTFKNGLMHKFNSAVGISFAYFNGSEYVAVTEIPYSYLGQTLNNELGANDPIQLQVKLIDGKVVDFEMQFISRKLTSVLIKSFGESNFNKYYIDPYDVSTYQVPTELVCNFENNGSIKLNAVYKNFDNTKFDSAYRLKEAQTNYYGGNFSFVFSLTGYGVADQDIAITVVVLKRQLKDGVATLAPHSFNNPIMALVSDMQSTVSHSDFKATGDVAFDADPKALKLPTIKWKLTNEDLTFGGIKNRKVFGNLAVGTLGLEEVSITISSPHWEFESIDIGNEQKVINFNPNTKESLQTTFDVTFNCYVDGTFDKQEVVAFYSKEYALSSGIPEAYRKIIDWDIDGNKEDNKHFFIGNNNKNVKIKVDEAYKYNYEQFTLKGVQFPYALNADTYQGSGVAELVLDPLTKIVPTKVLAKGELLTGGEIDLGYLTIQWKDNSIYAMPIGGGSKLVDCNLLTPSGHTIQFQVMVHYLDRTPERVSVRERDFSSTGNIVNGYYPIQVKQPNGKYVSTLNIDPINVNIYNEATKTYRMPAAYIYDFNTKSNISVVQRALNSGNATKELKIQAYELAEPISLYGTTEGKPIGVKFTKYTIDDSVFLTVDDLLKVYLNVTDREVSHTSISEGKISAQTGRTYQNAKAEYYIDPYAIKLPTTVAVYFKNASQAVTYTDIKWTINKDYIVDMINGNINGTDPAAMRTPGEFAIFGTTLKISFTIKGRGIVTEKNAAGGVIPLKGGKIYVLKNGSLQDQLPKDIYYKYKDKNGNIIDIAKVPLEFVEPKVDMEKVGVYPIVGNLGWGDKGNIAFDIEVIDPLLFNLETVTQGGVNTIKNGSLFYDKLAIAVDNNNFYISGIEKTKYPNRVLINNRFEELEVTNIEYYPEHGYAMVVCQYVFFTSGTDPNFSGSLDGSDAGSIRQSISFKVDILTYDYTKVEQKVELDAVDNMITVPLGTKLVASKLPKAHSGNVEIPLIWDFHPEGLEIVNTNKVGQYIAIGYYKNTLGRTIGLQLTIIINKETIDGATILVDGAFLDREYSGEKIDKVPVTFGQYLKPDGKIGDIDGYLIEYSIDNGDTWFTNQPVDVKADQGAYKMRISVEDVNFSGSRIFDMRIIKKRIDPNAIKFTEKQNGSSASRVEYEYNGLKQMPYIYGIPKGAIYNITVNGSLDINAIDASEEDYIINLIFPEQRNFRISTDESGRLICKLKINKKNLSYTVADTIVYSGAAMNAKVKWINNSDAADSGFLQDLDGLASVEYLYTRIDNEQISNRVRDVGKYNAVITIHGGKNYNDVICTGEFLVTTADLKINIGTVTSEYLEAIKSFTSSVKYIGLVGDDRKESLGTLIVKCISGDLSNIHMIGTYTLRADRLVDPDNIILNNYNIEWNDADGYGYGSYIITSEGFTVIKDAEELKGRIDALRDGDNARWLLKAGEYGDIAISKNASVAIVGSYTFDANNKPIIAVNFNSITITRGAVLLDIVNVYAKSDMASIDIGDNAGSVTVNRTKLSNQSATYLKNSIAIRTGINYSNKLYLDNTKIIGYNIAMFVQKGSLDMQNCLIDNNISGIYMGHGELSMTNNIISRNKTEGLYLHDVDSKISIVNNTFESNIVGIKTYREMRADITVENKFITNSINIYKIK